MTCENCLHERVCEKLCPKGLLPYQSSEYPAEIFCLEFKNKAEVTEVKYGKWTLHPDGSGTCSVCGKHQVCIWDLDNWQNFCGHCGADMRGEINECGI